MSKEAVRRITLDPKRPLPENRTCYNINCRINTFLYIVHVHIYIRINENVYKELFCCLKKLLYNVIEENGFVQQCLFRIVQNIIDLLKLLMPPFIHLWYYVRHLSCSAITPAQSFITVQLTNQNKEEIKTQRCIDHKHYLYFDLNNGEMILLTRDKQYLVCAASFEIVQE